MRVAAVAVPAVTRMTGTQTLLEAQASVRVLTAGFEAGDAGRHRDSLARVPMPAHHRRLDGGTALDTGAARPAADCEIPGGDRPSAGPPGSHSQP